MAKNQNDELIKYGKYAVLGLLGYYILKPFLKAGETVGGVVTSVAEEKIVKQQLELSDADVKLCKSVANDLNNAMYTHPDYLFGIGSFEDEDAVIEAINRLTSKGQVTYVASLYKTATKKSLLSDIKEHLSYNEQHSINADLFSYLT